MVFLCSHLFIILVVRGLCRRHGCLRRAADGYSIILQWAICSGSIRSDLEHLVYAMYDDDVNDDNTASAAAATTAAATR